MYSGVVVGEWEVDGCLVMCNLKLPCTFGGDARVNRIRTGWKAANVGSRVRVADLEGC